jgi:hypothetical protein
MLRTTIALCLITSLLFTSCGFFPRPFLSSKQIAALVVKELEAISDPEQRAVTAVYTLNTMCSLSRLAAGKAEGRVETTVAPYFASKVKPVARLLVRRLGHTLKEIPGTKRGELLGPFAQFDPGACAAAPQWEQIKQAVVLKTTVVPRLRTTYCAGNFTYADATNADRAITAASQFFAGIEAPGTLLSGASPVIVGVEGEHVTARHEALQRTAGPEGISPYGVATDIPCSPINDSCDASQGLICGSKINAGDTCIAFPVVQKDQNLVMRGYNFWDLESARLVFSPLLPNTGTESTAEVNMVEAQEPADGNLACPLPSSSNPTHNRAHFKVAANEDRFYRLSMYNRNGTFHTQRDAADGADSRVIHNCYPESFNVTNLPPGTIRKCTAPVETCPEDGKLCSATWTTPPRKLDQCRHLPNEPVVCGETPEWFKNEPLIKREAPESRILTEPIVYVMRDEPTYEFRGSLSAIECEDETNEIGSDEPVVFIAGLKAPGPPGWEIELLNHIDDIGNAWRGKKFDSSERRQINQLLSTVGDVKHGDEVHFFVVLAEDDGFLDGYLSGVAVIAIAAVIIGLSGGTAGAISGVWALIMACIAGDDRLGMTMLVATPALMDQRIGVTHAPDFLVNGTTLGPLPPAPNGPTEHQRANPFLIHPFEDFKLGPPLAAQCDPGPCASGERCLINRCVDNGFVDPTAGRGFRERREFAKSGYYYVLDLLWEKVRVP